MTVEVWTTMFVILTFMVYLYIGWRARVKDSKGFFVADQGFQRLPMVQQRQRIGCRQLPLWGWRDLFHLWGMMGRFI